MSTKVEMLHPCNIDPLVPELVRREPHNTHTCQSTECTAESYACSQTNYIISLPPEKKIVVMCSKFMNLIKLNLINLFHTTASASLFVLSGFVLIFQDSDFFLQRLYIFLCDDTT